jgi:hypothetical protein
VGDARGEHYPAAGYRRQRLAALTPNLPWTVAPSAGQLFFTACATSGATAFEAARKPLQNHFCADASRSRQGRSIDFTLGSAYAILRAIGMVNVKSGY